MVFYIARLVKSKRFCAKDFNIIMLEQIKDLITYAKEKLEPSSRDGEYKATGCYRLCKAAWRARS